MAIFPVCFFLFWPIVYLGEGEVHGCHQLFSPLNSFGLPRISVYLFRFSLLYMISFFPFLFKTFMRFTAFVLPADLPTLQLSSDEIKELRASDNINTKNHDKTMIERHNSISKGLVLLV